MKKRTSKGIELYTTASDIGGIDLSGKRKGKRAVCTYMENMYRDYEGDSPTSIESIPGFRRILNLGARVNSIFMQKCSDEEEYIIVHANSSLFRFNVKDRDNISSISSIATLNNGPSHAFHKGGTLFVSDCTQIIKIASDGSVSNISYDDDSAYTPTTFKNGVAYEQRNLLTNRFEESYVIQNYDRYYRASEGLRYTLNDTDGYCSVSGISASASGSVYIPKYAIFGDKRYKITEIEDDAFKDHKGISAVYVADGLKKIGDRAFSGCTGLTKMQCPSTVERIGDEAFFGCSSLTDVFIGKGIKSFGEKAFDGAEALTEVKFETSEAYATDIENISCLNERNRVFRCERPYNYYSIPIYTKHDDISYVLSDGIMLTFEIVKGSSESGYILCFRANSHTPPEGKKFKICGKLSPELYNDYEEGTDFTAIANGDTNIIAECRCSAQFDGRIFLAGNPKYPNTVFYSLDPKGKDHDKLFFGSLSYFEDGESAYKTVSLCPSVDSLIVLKAHDAGGGGIFYHESKAENGFLQRTYPLSYVHTGIGALGGAISRLDEAFFLSDSGVYSLKKGSSGNNHALCRSSAVNPMLLKNKNLEDAHIVSWLGYVAVQIGKEIYLADIRRGLTEDGEYEWYYLNNVGMYKGQTAVSKYMSFAPPGYKVHEKIDSITNRALGVVTNSEYGQFYYVDDPKDPSIRYAAYSAGYSIGGVFQPASCIFSDGKLLFIGTENGDVCVFNTDKRGVAPDYISSSPDFDKDKYSKAMGNKIHPDFYNNARRIINYALCISFSDADYSYQKKSTVNDTLTLKLDSIGTKKMSCEVLGDGCIVGEAGLLAATVLDFFDINFEAFSFEVANEFYTPVLYSPKHWMQTQVNIYSSEVNSPISISEISFRYRTTGKFTKK